MVNLILKLFGFGKAIDALDGEKSKTYVGAAQKMLLGAVGLLGGVAGLLGEFVQAHGGSAYLDLVQNLKHDPYAAAVVGGYALILAGYTDAAQRHATAKLQSAVGYQVSAPVAAPALDPAQPQGHQ